MTANLSPSAPGQTPPTPASTPGRGVDLVLIAVALVWGSSYLAAKEVATADNAFAFLTLRFAIATTALAALLAPRLRHLTRDELRLGALFGTVLAAIFTLETFGVLGTTATNAGLIISLTIIMTPLLQRAALGTTLPPAFYAAAATAVAGVALLTQGTGLAAPRGGDLLILAAAVARAVHIVVIARACRGRHLDTGRVTLVQLATALAVFAALSHTTGDGLTATATTLSGHHWALTAYLALACTVFAFLAQTWAVRRTNPARVSLLLGTEPLFAAAIGITLAADPLTTPVAVGAALVLAGTHWGRHLDTHHTRQQHHTHTPGTRTP